MVLTHGDRIVANRPGPVPVSCAGVGGWVGGWVGRWVGGTAMLLWVGNVPVGKAPVSPFSPTPGRSFPLTWMAVCTLASFRKWDRGASGDNRESYFAYVETSNSFGWPAILSVFWRM